MNQVLLKFIFCVEFQWQSLSLGFYYLHKKFFKKVFFTQYIKLLGNCYLFSAVLSRLQPLNLLGSACFPVVPAVIPLNSLSTLCFHNLSLHVYNFRLLHWVYIALQPSVTFLLWAPLHFTLHFLLFVFIVFGLFFLPFYHCFHHRPNTFPISL